MGRSADVGHNHPHDDGGHGHDQVAHGHMHDHEGHVEAVEADLEYWRAKRLEPYLIHLHRRGVLTFYDLMRTARSFPRRPRRRARPRTRTRAISRRASARLKTGSTITFAISALPRSCPVDDRLVIEDTRKERGDYDDFFRIAKPAARAARWSSASRGWKRTCATTGTCRNCCCARCSTKAS